MAIYVGTSGWVYAGWREHLYRQAPVRTWLQIASRTFNAVEINGSFYTQIKPETYARWRQETPDDFRFTLKGHRFVTHYRRLRDCEGSIVRLRDQASALGDKLRAVVWQLPSNFRCDVPRLASFARALEAWPGVRHALELRHSSWFVPAVADLMRATRLAICMGDAPDFPMWREVTTDLVYVRLHGHTRKYASSYSTPALRRWAEDARRWLGEGREVHVYFDNDAEGHAIRNAKCFGELVGAPAAEDRQLPPVELPTVRRRQAGDPPARSAPAPRAAPTWGAPRTARPAPTRTRARQRRR